MDSISLANALPSIFASEKIPYSGIWKTDVAFRRGNFYLVEATSGAGKSSMCAYIYGSRIDYTGEILFNSQNIRNFSMDKWQSLRRNNLAYLPQDLDLFPELTALENVQIKNCLTDAVESERILEWFHLLGIDNRTDTPVALMSVGQRQRVAIVRALCQPFDFLLLDEPVSHLDAENNRIAADIITCEARRRGASVISTSVGNHLMLNYDATIKL
ncbi:MAG: ATP-binding cassette domain-containing protein [Candidatus Amulumruptor caecigallinarius]|nr:ATP-binding cassette domain-containing protein [Candidatus Amulumruptor caecigallinarius]